MNLPDGALSCFAFTCHCCCTPLPCPQVCCHFLSKPCSFLHAFYSRSSQPVLLSFICQGNCLSFKIQHKWHIIFYDLLPKNFLFCTRLAPIDFLVVILVTFQYSGSSISPLASHLLNSSDMFMLYCVSQL